jgi:hypothetical protein
MQCALRITEESATFDEPAHLPAGYSYLLTGDFRMNPEHPPLTKMVAAIPLLFMKLKHPAQMQSWQGKDSFAFGQEFLYKSGQDADKIIFLGRIPMILLSVLLGLLVFSWSKELFGFKAGVLALFLYSFCPNILAHSSLVTPDIGVCLFMTFSFYSLWRYLKKPSAFKLVLTAVALGLALISKFNAIILLPTYAILILIYGPKKRFSQSLVILCLIFFIAFFIVWAGYGFQTGKILEQNGEHNTFYRLVKDLPRPLQERGFSLCGRLVLPFPYYFKGLSWMVYSKDIEKHQSFFYGKHFFGNSLYGLLSAFLIKTPIPFLIFLLMALWAAVRSKSIFGLNQAFILYLPLLIFILTPLISPALQIKYILPVYPLMCICISQLMNFSFSRLSSWRLIFVGLCLWYLIASINIYPHYLAYFNELIGGPKNGYKYLVDSNLDWGQDLKLLKKYLDKNNIKEIKLGYFGTASPDYYKISYTRLEPFKPASGWIAVSATFLQGAHTAKGGYDWLKNYDPVLKIGYSIFLYKV